jgi:hypothetical protein
VETPDIARYQPSQNYREFATGHSEVVLVCTLFTQTSLKHYDPETMSLEACCVFEPFFVWQGGKMPAVRYRNSRTPHNLIDSGSPLSHSFPLVWFVWFTFPDSANLWGNSSSQHLTLATTSDTFPEIRFFQSSNLF